MKYSSKRFDNELEMIEYANKQLKYGKQLHSFSVQGDMENSCIIAIFTDDYNIYNYKYEHGEYFITPTIPVDGHTIYKMMN